MTINIQPSVNAPAGAPVTCASCSAALVPSATANVFSNEDDWWVCDPCAEREAPELMPVLRALRKGGSENGQCL
jgi:hypothetical protein